MSNSPSDLTGRASGGRKLIAVVYADMVGYSRLIGLDDLGTLNRLKTLRHTLIDPAVDEHGGRIVQTAGDSLLIVFDSIDGAVRCAVTIQQQVPDQNSDHPSDRAVRFRVGINIGDVIPDGMDLHGDGVNVAARLQSVCPPGEICVSRAVHDHVHGHLDLVFEELGTLNLKNIARPIEAFLLKFNTGALGPHLGTTVTLPLPNKPSIAVLPFTNMSGDSEQEYFADGMAEEIIAALSRVPSFFVIARNSSFSYKGTSPDVRRVGRELGVRYVLEGSVRRAGTRVRIVGQLIDASTGTHIWADRFEGGLEDVFQLQDQVMTSIVGAIEPEVRAAEIERALRKSTDNLEAYDLVLRGRWAYGLGDKDAMEQSAQLLQHAITIDPNYALAFALLARTLWLLAAGHHSAPSVDELAHYVDLAKTAVQLGRMDPEALCFAAHIIALPGGELSEGIAIIDRSLAQNPNSADALAVSGMLRAYVGDTETAFRHLEQANRLSPLHVWIDFRTFAFQLACFVDGDYAGVVHWTTQGLRLEPSSIPHLRYRAAALGLLGRLDEARQAINRLLTLNPKVTVARARHHIEVEMKSPFKRPGVVEAYYEGLRLAGLSE